MISIFISALCLFTLVTFLSKWSRASSAGNVVVAKETEEQQRPTILSKIFHGHLECFTQLDIINETPRVSEVKRCAYSDYYTTALARLSLSTTSAYEKSVYKEILNLYSNLEVALIPIEVDMSMYPPQPALINRTKQLVHPICISFPVEHILETVPSKVKAFATVVPGVKSTYIYSSHDESLYYKDISESLFGWTYKKAGWDCFRHLEILSQGAIPLFPGIKLCPRLTMAFYPKSLFATILNDQKLNYSLSVNDGINFDGKVLTFDYKMESTDNVFHAVLIDFSSQIHLKRS